MATIPTLTYLPSDENVILQLISRPLPADADLFDVADNCAALVSVLVETDDVEAVLRCASVSFRLCAGCANSAMPIFRHT
jgi:hypothetical protein